MQTPIDPEQLKLEAHSWADATYNTSGSVIINGEYDPYLSVKLDANGHYQIIREDRGVSTPDKPQIDTLTGTYGYDILTKSVKFYGDKVKLVPIHRANTPKTIYLPNWKIKSFSGDTLRVDLDYIGLPFEPGLETYKVLVKQ